MSCRILVSLLAMICLTAVGCVRGTRPAPDLTYLDISPGNPPVNSGISREVLLLRRLDVESPFDERRFLYRTGSGTFESDYYVRFVASPADLLTDRLEAWLSEANLFRAIVEPGSSVEYRFILEGQILELYGDYSNPRQPLAILKAEFILVDDLEGAGKIVLNRQYRHAEPVVSSDPSALSSGWGTALRSTLLELVEDLQGTLADDGG